MCRKSRLFTLACVCIMAISSCHGQHNDHNQGHSHQQKTEKNMMEIKKPNRVSHTYEQTINGSVQEIFPLYCPVRELDWCENWDPKVVYTNSGLVEKDCIFITSHGKDDIVWIVDDYDIETGHVEMFYHVPNVLVTKLEIQVEAITEEKTKATLTYSKTSLSEMGDHVLEQFTQEHYDIMMDSWEKAMNHYLETGEMLTGLPNF